MASIISVNRILFRRSGTLNMFLRLESNGTTPFQSAGERGVAVGVGVAFRRRTAIAERRREDRHATPGCGDGAFGRLGECMSADADLAIDVATAEHLHEGGLV